MDVLEEIIKYANGKSMIPQKDLGKAIDTRVFKHDKCLSDMVSQLDVSSVMGSR